MEKIKYSKLDSVNKLLAVSQMFALYRTHGWPNGKTWEDEADIINDLSQDYNADEHFSFYLNEFDEVETKIG